MIVIEPLDDGVEKGDKQWGEKIYLLGGASLGIREDIPCLAFGTGDEIRYQFYVFQGSASPEDLEHGPG